MAPVLGGTIVARASGPGHSTRAIVRLSGPEAIAALEAIAARGSVAGSGSSTPRGAPASPVPGADGVLRTRGAHRVRLALHVGGVPCELPAIALVMPAPRSFTGEDCVELLLPGNPALADAAVDALLRTPGVGAAAPGAFMARAHAAGRIAIADAERIALEIGAAHARELEAARQVQSNPLVQAAHAGTAQLADLLARIEAGIDFTDSEDVVAISLEDLRTRAHSVRNDLVRWIEGSVPVESMRTLPMVALRGAPNAGKSSLFNALLGRTRSVASPLAGTTRDAIGEEIELQSPVPGGARIPVLLVDTPGIEDPHGAIDALMQAQAQVADHADVILLCEPLASERPAHALPAGAPTAHAAHVIRVATRSDESPAGTSRAIAGAICTSVVTGDGIRALSDAIASAVAAGNGAPASAHRIGALSRHREAMAQAAEWIVRAIDAAGDGPGPAVARPELVADALRGALDSLGEVTGEVTPDDVLGLVFSRFCIGK
jgi:tRNA modification GTPase